MTTALRFATAVLLTVAVAGVGTASASGVQFALDAEAAPLVAAGSDYFDNGDPGGSRITQRSTFHLGLVQGQPFALFAHSQTCTRAAPCHESKPDTAAWTYDTDLFRALPAQGGDVAGSTLRLQAVGSGHTRLRFAADLLGYKQVFEVEIEILPLI